MCDLLDDKASIGANPFGTLDITAPLPPHMKQTWNLFGWDEAEGDVE